MNYKRLYLNLISVRRNNILNDSEYTEKHHIVPKCLGGNNAKKNIVRLTAREHFIAHWILVKIHPNNRSLMWAFLMMGNNKRTQRKLTSRQYQIIRANFSRNHPNKNNTCFTEKMRNYAAQRKLNKEPLPLCACGCGERVKSKRWKYAGHGHHTRNKKRTLESISKTSLTMKKRLEALTPQQLQQRMTNSRLSNSVNHVERARKISETKRLQNVRRS